MRIIDDASALNASTIDVAARVAWTTRMARVTSTAIDDVRLATLAQRIGVSATHLSRIETGQRRDGSLFTAYEKELGLAEGTLCSPVEIIFRTFGAQSPHDVASAPPIIDVAVLSGLTDELLTGDPVTGGTWLRWARELSRPNNVSLPISLFLQLCRRLVDELSRAVDDAYAPRRNALALLGASAYGNLVLDVARETVERPYAPGLTSLTGVIGKSPLPAVVDWALELLHDDRDDRVEGGAHALDHLGQVTGGAVWSTVADRLLAAFDASKPDSAAEEWTAHLIRLVPRSLWHELAITPSRTLPPGPTIVNWGQDSPLWKHCAQASEAITGPLGLPPQPMLTRLLFDATFSPWESRAVTSSMLLCAVPALANSLTGHLADHVRQVEQSAMRHRATRRFLAFRHSVPAATTERWFDAEAAIVRRAAFTAAGNAGTLLDESVLRRGIVDPDTSREAIYAAGMTQHPALAVLSRDATLPPATRAGLAWFLDQGGRITR